MGNTIRSRIIVELLSPGECILESGYMCKRAVPCRKKTVAPFQAQAVPKTFSCKRGYRFELSVLFLAV